MKRVKPPQGVLKDIKNNYELLSSYQEDHDWKIIIYIRKRGKTEYDSLVEASKGNIAPPEVVVDTLRLHANNIEKELHRRLN